MSKTILMTGATDGIGLETAKQLAANGHRMLLHGRSTDKLDAALQAVGGTSETYQADLSHLNQVDALASEIAGKHSQLDVIINNAGVLKAPVTRLTNGRDIRFVVNTFAPVRLTNALLPLLAPDGRIVNLSSAAQASVDLAALCGEKQLADMEAYAQSKLAITIWSQELAKDLAQGQITIAVNPGSLLASKMVKDGFGLAGNDIGIGVDILIRASLSDEFLGRSGQYFDNDAGVFSPPHADAANPTLVSSILRAVEVEAKV